MHGALIYSKSTARVPSLYVITHSRMVKYGCKLCVSRLPLPVIALPSGVGSVLALRWYHLGFRSYQDVKAALQPGGTLAPDGRFPAGREVTYCMRYWRDILEPVSAEDVAEMKRHTLQALADVSGATGGRPDMLVPR